jgi:hypothetical protein
MVRVIRRVPPSGFLHLRSPQDIAHLPLNQNAKSGLIFRASQVNLAMRKVRLSVFRGTKLEVRREAGDAAPQAL